MKKISYHIRKGTKELILGLSILGVLGLSAITHNAKKVASTFAFVGIVAGFKKKGIDLSDEEQITYKAFDEILKQNFEGTLSSEDAKTQFNELKESITPEALKKLVDGANEEINEALRKQAIAIDQLKTMGFGGPGAANLSLKEQIKAELLKDGNKTSLEAFKNKQPGAQLSFNVKAAATMEVSTTTAYTTAGTAIAMPSAEVIPGLNNVARNQPFILQLLRVMATSKANIIYTEKYNPQGNAYEVGEGVAAPLVSFDIQIGDSRAKLVDAMIKVSVQMMDDIDYMVAEIENELIYQVAIRIDTQLLQGDGAGDNLKGIKTYAGGYTLTTLSTVNPNNCDAILAAATQIASANFRPDIAVINPIDFANTKLLKGTTGYYIVNPNNENSKWDNITVVQSNQVPVGYTLVMDSSRTNVFNLEGFTISYGWVNDDFQKNLVSIMGKQRLHNFIKANDVLGFVYDSFANIKTAITAV